MAENNLLENGRLVQAKGHLIGARSGLMTGLAADAIVAAIRNVGPEECVLAELAMGFIPTTASTGTLVGGGFAAYKVAGFTALPTGGRAVDPVPVRKRTRDATVLAAASAAYVEAVVQVEIANTAALTPGTPAAPTVDDPFAALCLNVSVVAGTFTLQGQSRWEPRNHIPVTLAPDEGIMILNQAAFPTALAGRLYMLADVHFA